MIEYEVPPCVVTKLTGKIGSALQMRGKVSYRVNLEEGRSPICLRNGVTVDPTYNATMLKMVKSVCSFFEI